MPPPEDVGGLWSYEKALAVLADPTDPEHLEKREWMGEDFDSERFDREVVNALVVESFAPKPRIEAPPPAPKG